MRFLKRINERGTVTLPLEVREALEVSEGDIVEFEVLGVVRKKVEAAVEAPEKAATTPAAEVSQ